MDRKSIEAELDRKKKELAKLQKQFLKAENGHRWSQKNRMAAHQMSLADTAEVAVPTVAHSPSLTPRDSRNMATSFDLSKSSSMHQTKTSTSTPQSITTSWNTKTILQDTESIVQDITQDTKVSACTTCQDSSSSQTMRTSVEIAKQNDRLDFKIGSKYCGDDLNPTCTSQDLLDRGYFEHDPYTLSCVQGRNIPAESPSVCLLCPPDASTNIDQCKTVPPLSTCMPFYTSRLPCQTLTSLHTIIHDITTSPHTIPTNPHDVPTTIPTSSHDVPTSPHTMPTSPHDITTRPHAINSQQASETYGAVMSLCAEPHPLPSRMAFPPLVSMPTMQLDFYLPDDEYQAMKLLKLTSVKNDGTAGQHWVMPTPVPGLGRSGVRTQTSRVAEERRVQPEPVSVEAVSTRVACTELTLANLTQLGYYGHQNDCGILPNCCEGSKNACVWEHMFDGTSQDTYRLDSSFNFKTTVEVVGSRLLGVVVTKGTLSIVHLEEEKRVCMHMLSPGASMTPNTNWLYASWMLHQGECLKSCFLLIQENTTFCFVAVSEDKVVTGLRLCVVNSNEGYILNMEASGKSCSQAQIHSWPSGDQVLVAMALTEEVPCHSIVRVWALVKDDKCRWGTIDGLGTQLPLPNSVGIIISLHEVVGVAQQLLGTTSASAVLWDVRSHGLLVVVALCCCLSGCRLQPVVVGTSAEESTLFLLLGCKQGTLPPSEESREDKDGKSSSVAWLVACRTTDPAVSNECPHMTHCDLVQSYTCTSTRPWGYQWCEDTLWNFATRVSHNTLLLWSLLSNTPCGTLSFGEDLGVGLDDVNVYWLSDRKQMIVVSGDSVYILSSQSSQSY